MVQRATNARLTALAALALAGLWWSLGAASAQQPPAPTPQRLDSARTQLDTVERTLARQDLNDATLAEARASLDPVTATVESVVDELAPQLAGVKARLDQLGPKPDAKAPPENPTVTVERDEQQKKFDEFDGLLKRARLIGVQAGQDSDSIAARRRALFTGALLLRSDSVLSPALWLTVARELPRNLASAAMLSEDWVSMVARRLGAGTAAISFAALLGLIVLATLVVSRLARRVLSREPAIEEPSRLRKILGALWVAGVRSVVPIVAAVALAGTLRSFDLVNERFSPLLDALVSGVTRIALTVGLARGLLAPRRPSWRLLELTTPMTERLTRLGVTIAIIITAGKVLEAIESLTFASVRVTVATDGLAALAVGLVMLFALKGILPEPDPSDDCLGPIVAPTPRDWYGPLRIAAWIVLSAIIVATVVGYVAFATFLVDQIAWVTLIGVLTFLLVGLANDGLNGVLKPQARLGRGVITSIGLRRESLEQAAILASGLATLVIMLVAVLLVLAPWGVASNDLLSNVRAAYFGFRVGEVTISLSDIVLGLVLFAGGLALTRMLQRWLDTRYLPRTQLDPGLRNSIRTSLGYVGFVLAASLALANVGLSFDKLAIVAGALSVGIGFGLQSIVNNFVSGLIILWERTIRVGDWVVVGADQGHVRRINVRSTEIETFDRSMMIVPNSTLVGGTVTNRVRGDRAGRVKIAVSVAVDSDPERVRDILLGCAAEQKLIVALPAPAVLFTEIGESRLSFELICTVADVETAGRIKSELHFAILKRFKEAGLAAAPPPPPAETVVRFADAATLARLFRAEPSPPAQDPP